MVSPKARADAKADMAKLADAPDLGSGGAIHVGSTPIIRTKEYRTRNKEFRTSKFGLPCSLLVFSMRRRSIRRNNPDGKAISGFNIKTR